MSEPAHKEQGGNPDQVDHGEPMEPQEHAAPQPAAAEPGYATQDAAHTEADAPAMTPETPPYEEPVYMEPETQHVPVEPQQAAADPMAYQADAAPVHQATGNMHETAAVPAGVIAGDMDNVRPVPRVSIQAFCETQGVANTLEAAAQDRRMAKTHTKVQMGGVPAAVDFYQTATTPNLILVESRLGGMELIGQLENLAEVCDEGTNVVVIGHNNDVQLYRELISRGVGEYLVAPISMAEVMEIISTLFVNPESEPLGNSVAFIGSKGGVGSSTVAHNVAWAISSKYESDVILTDLDLPFGTANMDFDQDPAQGVAEAVFSSDRIDDTFLDRLLAKCSDHLSLLAAPSTLDREYDFEANDFMQLLEVAQRGTPNVIIDLPHMWTGWIRQIVESVDKLVITATPDLASLRNTKNLVDTLKELRPNDEKPLLVINQCNVPKRPEISVADFTGPLDLEPTIVIPFEPAIFGLAANNGQMISEADPKHEIGNSFDLLAQALTGRREIQPEQQKQSVGSLLSRLRRKKSA